VDDCSLMAIEQFFSYIKERTS